MSSGVRIILIVLGVVGIVVGVVFAGQGLGLIPGSFMTGNREYLAIGVFIAVVGIVLVTLGLRRRRRPGR